MLVIVSFGEIEWLLGIFFFFLSSYFFSFMSAADTFLLWINIPFLSLTSSFYTMDFNYSLEVSFFLFSFADWALIIYIYIPISMGRGQYYLLYLLAFYIFYVFGLGRRDDSRG